MALPPNTTLADLRDGLSEEYVRGVVDRMYEAAKNHRGKHLGKECGPPTVSVSITSDPRCPDYLVHVPMDHEGGRFVAGVYPGKGGAKMFERRENSSV